MNQYTIVTQHYEEPCALHFITLRKGETMSRAIEQYNEDQGNYVYGRIYKEQIMYVLNGHVTQVEWPESEHLVGE